MTTIYTNVTQRFNRIFFRGYKNGNRIQSKLNYTPSLYIKTEDPSDAVSLYGDNLEKRSFSTIGEAKTFVKENSNIYAIHGNTKYEYAFIHDQFQGEQAVSLSDLTVHSIDIETSVEHNLGIQEMLRNPLEEILLISIIDYNTKELTTFGARPVDETIKNYIKCDNEVDLMKRFISFVETQDPDIITGWNSNGFDISYICSRINRVLGEEWMLKLSPFRIVERSVSTFNGRETILYDIAGRSTLDLLELYKKFRFINRESYRLDFIAEVELGENKLKMPGDSFKDSYDNYWNIFVAYNQRDVELVDKLEQKLGLIYLAVSLAYVAKINYSDVYSPIKTWEQYIQYSLKDDNTFIPLRVFASSNTQIEGGYVKEPIPGYYKWIVSFDFTSLYPKIIEALNVSPECFIGMTNCSVSKILEGAIKNETPYTLAANGAQFSKEKLGIMTRLTAGLFDKRKQSKDLMKEAKKRYQETKDDSYKKEADRYNVLQLATKVCLNSLFGATASPYFIFFDNRMAEGITMTGQAVIQYVSRDINEYLKKTLNIKKDLLLMADTDSSFFNFGPLVEKYCQGKTDEQVAKFLNKVIEEKIRPIILKSTQEYEVMTNCFKGKFDFKLEKIASAGIITGKKRYAVRVLENEGIKYAEPETAITGIEVVRSSTPQIARKWLKEAIEIVLDEDKDRLVEFVEEKRIEFRSQNPEAIAFPRSANNIDQYSDSSKLYKKGCPIGVRASILYNHYLNLKTEKGKYEPILEGDKMKFIYLKVPNTIREDVIAFSQVLPPEFGLHKYIDYDLQFEKVFLDPLKNIADAIKWNLNDRQTLDEFF